jgi:hypothetical protein
MPRIGFIWAMSLLLCCLRVEAGEACAAKECMPDDGHPRPEKKVPPRRAVPQVIERVPPVAPAARTGVPVIVPPVNIPAPAPAITGCDAGGCRDSTGNRYNGSNGVYLNGSGRQCQRTGTSMQCF